MVTRRALLAGSAAALLTHATSPSWRSKRAPRVIDVHAHWYPPQWLELIEKESGETAPRSSATRAAIWWR